MGKVFHTQGLTHVSPTDLVVLGLSSFVSGFMAGQFLGFFAFDSNKRFHHDEVVSGIISVFLLFEKFRNQGCESSSIWQISFTSSRQFGLAVIFTTC